MGRPRKRQHIETTRDEPIEVFEASENIVPEGGNPAYVNNEFSIYGDPTVCEPNQSSFGLPPLPLNHGRSSIIESGRQVWHFGDRQVVAGPSIDYGSIFDYGSWEDDPMTLLEPQLSTTISDPSSTPNSDDTSSQAILLASCGCLAGMYLALASMQTLPTEIVPALRIVRGAAATAAQSIWCPQCGSVVLENPNPPIESFQNMMLLGTILPIIANGYHRLLKMVDDETDKATASGSTKTFRFQ